MQGEPQSRHVLLFGYLQAVTCGSFSESPQLEIANLRAFRQHQDSIDARVFQRRDRNEEFSYSLPEAIPHIQSEILRHGPAWQHAAMQSSIVDLQ